MWNRRGLAYAGLLAAGLYLWLRSLDASFWLDETLSHWVVSGSFDEMRTRSSDHQFGSLYYWLLWPVAAQRSLPTEMALRLPSILAALGAAFLVQRIARDFFEPDAAFVAAIAFVCIGSVARAASQARPYALGLLLVVAAMALHLRWLQTRGGRRQGAAGVALACLSAYVQPLLVLVVAVQGLSALRAGLSRAKPIRELLGLAALAAALLLPLLLRLPALLENREALSWARQPTALPLLGATLLPVLLFTPVQLSRAEGRWRAPAWLRGEPLSPAGRRLYPVILLWALVPPLVLLAVSTLTATQLFAPRYLIGAAPALAVLLGGFAQRMSRPWLQVLLAAALVAFAAIRIAPHEERYVDWRAASAAVRLLGLDSETPVLFHSGLIESARIEWIEDPARRDYLQAPLHSYPVPGRPLLLPYDVRRADARPYLEELFRSELAHAERFVLVGRFPAVFLPWLTRRAGDFEPHRAGPVVVFERRRR